MVTGKAIADILRTRRFRYSNEDALQEAIADLLAELCPVEREVRLSAQDRIDLLADGRIGIEVKVAGQPATVERQLRRYAAHDRIEELILVTSRVRHRPAAHINGKRVHVVSVVLGGL